ADPVTLFARYGAEARGSVRFDRAVTLGAEIGGSGWGRASDWVGVASAVLHTSAEYRNATADGTRAGYAASGSEREVELYYRWRVTDRFDLTPDLQWLQRPGGDPAAPRFWLAALRARVGF
ncbi:MAG TPA: carbohydrate porin, partial [Vicinamibacterales bacterium]|nr:carbohydrate porin [Vicinamibacterales bacterium]